MTVEELIEELRDFPDTAIILCEVTNGATPTEVDYSKTVDGNVYAVLNDYYKVGT